MAAAAAAAAAASRSYLQLVTCSLLPLLIVSEILSFCNRSTSFEPELKSGIITTPNSSANQATQICRLSVKGCRACRIVVTFRVLRLRKCRRHFPTGRQSCMIGCNHLLTFESGYPETTGRIIFNYNVNTTITTISNQLQLIYCHHSGPFDRIAIDYRFIRKDELVEGATGSIRHVTSPNFPSSYSRADEVYSYRIRNTDPHGFIRLSFTDWQLFNCSNITIGLASGQRPVSVVRLGSDTRDNNRPFVVSAGSELNVSLNTGSDVIQSRFRSGVTGFRAEIQFVGGPEWKTRPAFVHTKYFSAEFGGAFVFEKCWPKAPADFLWVVTVPHYRQGSKIEIRLHQFEASKDDWLLIREGNSSLGDVLYSSKSNSSSVAGRRFVSASGFHVRFRARCTDERKLNVTFVSFSDAKAGVPCPSQLNFTCRNRRCIAPELRCDGHGHCDDGDGDDSDERDCHYGQYGEGSGCSRRSTCRNQRHFFCAHRKCDGSHDCPDGSDEWDCSNVFPTARTDPASASLSHYTMISISFLLLLATVVIAVMFSCCMRHKRLARHRHRGATSGAILPLPGPSSRPSRASRDVADSWRLSGEPFVAPPESPPAYSEAIVYGQTVGYFNQGYHSADAVDFQLPPPYYVTETSLAQLPVDVRRPVAPQPIGDVATSPKPSRCTPLITDDKRSEPLVLPVSHDSASSATVATVATVELAESDGRSMSEHGCDPDAKSEVVEDDAVAEVPCRSDGVPTGSSNEREATTPGVSQVHKKDAADDDDDGGGGLDNDDDRKSPRAESTGHRNIPQKRTRRTKRKTNVVPASSPAPPEPRRGHDEEPSERRQPDAESVPPEPRSGHDEEPSERRQPDAESAETQSLSSVENGPAHINERTISSAV